MYLQITAAIIPPIIGAIIKSHNWERLSPPTRAAGPMLLAGFTDVPVIGIPIRWMRTKEKPIDIPAKPFDAFLLVEPNSINKNNPVNTTSAIKQDIIEYFAGDKSP